QCDSGRWCRRKTLFHRGLPAFDRARSRPSAAGIFEGNWQRAADRATIGSMSAHFLKSAPLLISLMMAPVGCTFLKSAIGLGPKRPKVRVQGIEVKYASLQALTLMVTIKIDNPNDFELSLKNLN